MNKAGFPNLEIPNMTQLTHSMAWLINRTLWRRVNSAWLLLLATLMATLFAPSPALAQITVFPECNFIGAAVNLPEGDYTRSELLQRGVADNSIASLIVSEGFAVQIYTDDRFSGRSGKLLDLNRCLDNTHYSKSISSVSVFRIDAAGNALAPQTLDTFSSSSSNGAALTSVELYSECDYAGKVMRLDAGKFTASELQQRGFADNTISSIRVPKGMKIELYENDFYRGRSGSLAANSDCLVDRFNNLVSSVIVSGVAEASKPAIEQTASQALAVQVYTSCDYRGLGANLPIGEYNAADLAATGLSDNSIASIRVPAGVEALIFENDFSTLR